MRADAFKGNDIEWVRQKKEPRPKARLISRMTQLD
jgi:hypothetical protein